MEKLEQLQQLKSLLDDGAITQEEYDVKKKEILEKENESPTKSSNNTSQKSSLESNQKQFINNCKLVKSTSSRFSSKVIINLSRKTIDAIKANKITLLCVGSALGLLGVIIGTSVHDTLQYWKAEKERAYNDSIAAVRAAEKAERDRFAKWERDCIARIQQLKKDSIDKAEHQSFVKKYANLGLMITYLEMTRGFNKDNEIIKGIKFKIFNPTQMSIKYVSAIITPINAVNDALDYPTRCQGIGPVSPLETGEWEFSDVFTDKNDIIDDLSVVFEVIYTNGRSKTIKWKDAYVSSYKSSWFR